MTFNIRQKKDAIIISLLLIVASIWIFNHPYRGLFHDAKLYMVQAMSYLEPVFKSDLFLRFESQEKYTLFSRLYASIIHLTTPSFANMSIFILGQVLWVSAAYLVVGLFTRGYIKFIALALAFLLPSYYDGLLVFAFGESFLTPRIFAEAFVLFSIYFMLNNSFIFWGISLMLAVVVHPIMAITGIILSFAYYGLKNLKVLLGLILLVLISFCFAIIGIQPFTRLITFIDADWAAVLHRSKDYLFLSEWGLGGFIPIVTSFLCVLLYAFITKGKRQRLAISLLIATLVTLLASFVFGDILGNLFTLQIQLWRFEWILIVLSYLIFPALFFRLRKQNRFNLSFAVAFIGSWFSRRQTAISSLIILIAVFLLVLGSYLRKTGHLSDRFNALDNLLVGPIGKWLDRLLCVLVLVLTCVDLRIFIAYFLTLPGSTPFVESPPFFNAPYGLFAMTVAGTVLLWLQMRFKREGLIVLSLILFSVSIALWDQRLEFDKLLLNKVGTDRYLSEAISKKAEILWPQHADATWFLLKRRNYASGLQGAGSIFSRDTTFLLNERNTNVGFLKIAFEQVFLMKKYSPSKVEGFLSASLQKGCRNSKDLDYAVLSYNLTRYKPTRIISLKNIRVNYVFYILNYKDFDWFLYDCNMIRGEK